MDLRLLWRFHVVPGGKAFIHAVREGPLVFAVAGFLAATLVGLTLAGFPVWPLERDPVIALAEVVGVTAVVAVLLVAGTGAARWHAFFQARPRGARARLVYLAARGLGAWWVAALVIVGVSGPPWPVAMVLMACAVPFGMLVAAVGQRPVSGSARPSMGPRLVGRLAWWLGQPPLFVLPPVAWSALLVWAASPGSGLAWADRPPVVDLLLDFSWPTVFGLLWSEVSTRLPYRYFRMARAPFRRVLASVAWPVVAATALVVVVEVALGGAGTSVLRAVCLSVAGAAFWFAYWLRFGPATLAHLMAFITLFLVGASLELEWWPLWAVAQAAATVALLAGWRTRYYEGESHAGS